LADLPWPEFATPAILALLANIIDKERKALRAACRAGRDAVDASITRLQLGQMINWVAVRSQHRGPVYPLKPSACPCCATSTWTSIVATPIWAGISAAPPTCAGRPAWWRRTPPACAPCA
jgi:hypothetical protein